MLYGSIRQAKAQIWNILFARQNREIVFISYYFKVSRDKNLLCLLDNVFVIC